MLTGALVVVLFASRADGISVGRVDVHATPNPVKICFDLPSTHTGVSGRTSPCCMFAPVDRTVVWMSLNASIAHGGCRSPSKRGRMGQWCPLVAHVARLSAEETPAMSLLRQCGRCVRLVHASRISIANCGETSMMWRQTQCDRCTSVVQLCKTSWLLKTA